MNNTKLTDEQLALQLQNGNTNAMGELYSRYYMLVFAKCRSFTKNTDDANDLAQDIMLRVMEKIGSFRGEAKFSTWLYSITFNYCTDNARKTKGKYFEAVDLQYDLIDHADSELEMAISKEVRVEKITTAILSIPSEDKELLLMKYQYNKSVEDLQQAYGISASAIKMRLMRARSKAARSYNSSMNTMMVA